MTTRPATTFTTLRSALALAPTEQARCDNVHTLHSLVLAGIPAPMPSETDPEPRPQNVLFAAHRSAPLTDRQRHHVAARPERVLVQAPARPDWQPLIDAGRLTSAHTFPVEHRVQADDIIGIKVIVSPVMRSVDTRKRLSLTAPHEAADWLQRHLSRAGLDTALGDITPGERVRITGNRKGVPITVVCRDMAARSRVRDPERLVQALTTGLGPSKAYGCGLLRIRLTDQNRGDKIVTVI
ncbi:type I-E CRISPR-associated protein Cas6/Cse3/CasE [Streptomyces anulatus]|uniref:type I-E CRISPR-associated protein Cas6/Cse3/CasE n=1 Tax=Streptomyces anulatus TaxID=1892 RepID=UPI002F91B8A8